MSTAQNSLVAATPDQGRTVSVDAVAGGWGLWHRGKKRWVSWPLTNRRAEFASQADAARHKIQRTQGKRDPLTNYFRLFVSPKRLEGPNNKPTDAPNKGPSPER